MIKEHATYLGKLNIMKIMKTQFFTNEMEIKLVVLCKFMLDDD